MKPDIASQGPHSAAGTGHVAVGMPIIDVVQQLALGDMGEILACIMGLGVVLVLFCVQF